LDIIVSSFGGVGTSPFLSWLSPKMDVNCPRDSDGLKHTVDPFLVQTQAQKFIFIFGDPVEALISLYSRKFIRPQFKKLTGQDNKASIEEYAESGKDLIGYEKQFDNWTNFNEKPVLFLKYPHFWENEKEILDFLQLSGNVQLFQKKQRTSDKGNISKEVIDKLELIYKPLREKMDRLGTCCIK
tara:strand:+ start:7404 stop:7955 length:552 start_codon:yes stop_codon:yes gene_type:complete